MGVVSVADTMVRSGEGAGIVCAAALVVPSPDSPAIVMKAPASTPASLLVACDLMDDSTVIADTSMKWVIDTPSEVSTFSPGCGRLVSRR